MTFLSSDEDWRRLSAASWHQDSDKQNFKQALMAVKTYLKTCQLLQRVFVFLAASRAWLKFCLLKTICFSLFMFSFWDLFGGGFDIEFHVLVNDVSVLLWMQWLIVTIRFFLSLFCSCLFQNVIWAFIVKSVPIDIQVAWYLIASAHAEHETFSTKSVQICLCVLANLICSLYGSL